MTGDARRPHARRVAYREAAHGRSERDPIAELVERVRVDDLPSDAWLARWSAGGRDPVAAAWEASLDYGAMWTLLAMIRRMPEPPSFWQRLLGRWHYTAEFLRQRVAVPPTLAEAVEAGRRDRKLADAWDRSPPGT